MDLYECLSICPVLFARFIVWLFPCIGRHKRHFKLSLVAQLQSCRSKRGGYWSNADQSEIDTRESFYTFLGLGDQGIDDLVRFVHRLAENMNRKGQVPARWSSHWWKNERPHYRSKIKEVPVVDSNIYFLILVWKLHEKKPGAIQDLYLTAQRAFKWLEKHIADDTFYEPVDSSWDTTSEHSGSLLLTNVLMIKAIHSMELIALIHKDTRTKDRCIKLHGKFIEKWQPELYRTQEVLPRILALHWNILPTTFLMSFNQELKDSWIPLRTGGPLQTIKTTRSWLRGRDDMHSDVIWPFVGFLWIIVLAKSMKRELANHWWDNYLEFHAPMTIHNMYDSTTGKPIRRAFLRSTSMHAAGLSLYFAAKNALNDMENSITALDWSEIPV